jgi:hypothetical protein
MFIKFVTAAAVSALLVTSASAQGRRVVVVPQGPMVIPGAPMVVPGYRPAPVAVNQYGVPIATVN